MRFIIFASLFATSLAALRGYAPPLPPSNGAIFPPAPAGNGNGHGHGNGAGFPSNGNGLSNGAVFPPVIIGNGHHSNGAVSGNGHHSNGAVSGNGHHSNGAVANGHRNGAVSNGGHRNGAASNGLNGKLNGAAAANGHFGGNGRVEPSTQYGAPSAPSNGIHSNGISSNGQGIFEQRFEASSGNGHGFGIPLPGVGNGAAPAEHPQDAQLGVFEQGFIDDGSSVDFGSTDEISCAEGEVADPDGNCVEAEISKSIYIYNAPAKISVTRAEIVRPKPKLNYNIVFVRTPEESEEDKPIIVPPPQQKTIVYVLSKGSEEGDQEIIEIPAGPDHKPEVFYISYGEGENPQLPLGLDLESALASAVSHEGKTVEIEQEATGDDLSGQVDLRVQVEGEDDADLPAVDDQYQAPIPVDIGVGSTNGFTNGASFGSQNGAPLNGFGRQNGQHAQPSQPQQPSGLYNTPSRRRI